MEMFFIAIIWVFVKISSAENSISRYINIPCATDAYCIRLEASLRCQRRRCQCGGSWRLVNGVCVSLDDLRVQKEKKVENNELLSVLMPTIFLYRRLIFITSAILLKDNIFASNNAHLACEKSQIFQIWQL